MKICIQWLSVCVALAAAGCSAGTVGEPDDEDDFAGGEVATLASDLGSDNAGPGCAATTLFEEDFADNAAGWTLEAGWQIGSATTSTCQTGGSPDPGSDHTATSDNGVAGVFIGGCPSIVYQSPNLYLTSPVIDTNVAGSVSLSFSRWLNTSYRNRSRVEVFDGASWVLLYESPVTLSSSNWAKITYDLTPYKNASLRVRVGYRTTIAYGGWVTSNWNIDDLSIDACP